MLRLMETHPAAAVERAVRAALEGRRHEGPDRPAGRARLDDIQADMQAGFARLNDRLSAVEDRLQALDDRLRRRRGGWAVRKRPNKADRLILACSSCPESRPSRRRPPRWSVGCPEPSLRPVAPPPPMSARPWPRRSRPSAGG